MKPAKKFTALALLIVMVLTSGTCFWLHTRFVRAAEYINRLNLELNPFTGAEFGAHPKPIAVQQAIARADLINHLKRINYTDNGSPAQPGSYRLDGQDRLTLWSRRPEFKSARIEFKGEVVAAIYTLPATDGQGAEAPAQMMLVEPEMLGAFVPNQKEEANKNPLFARRFPVAWSALEGQHIYYAVVAREDRDFETHHGVSWKGMARAVVSKLQGGHSGGGSTITIQVVKNFITGDWKMSLFRKVDELFYAAALETRLAKKDIFLLYANGIYMGAGSGSPLYGFSAAADEYFGKGDLRLTLNEACVLSIMINRPGYYLEEAAKGNYEPLRERRADLLDAMHQQWPDRYPLSVIAAVKTEPIRFTQRRTDQKSPLDNLSEPFALWAIHQQPLQSLKTSLPPEEYARLRFYCTMDADLMRESSRLISSRIPVFEKRFPAASTDPENPNPMLASIIALDPRNGEVIVMSGGAGGSDGYKFARPAIQAKARIASAWKPFLQALAFEQRATLENGQPMTPASFVDASGYAVNGWHPLFGLKPPGRLRTLLAASGNDYSTFLTARLGLPTTVVFFQQVFGQSINNPTGEVCIGLHPEMTVSPLKLATAYTMFARGGYIIEPKPFTSLYLDDRPLELAENQTRSLLRAEATYLTAQMMRSVTGSGLDGAFGTLREAFQQSGLPLDQMDIAAKSGSGPEAVWAVSVSPHLVVVAWLGYLRSPAPDQSHQRAFEQYQERLKQFTAGRTVGYLLTDFLQAVRKHRPDLLAGTFARPASITEVGIDPKTGCRSDAGGSVREFFMRGTEPAAANH
jgi:membrane peptidoglycan carboxypeptidase